MLGTLAGGAMKQGRQGIRHRLALSKAKKTLSLPCKADALGRVDNLTPAFRECIVQFIGSSEFEQFTLQLVIAVSSKKKKMIEALRKTLRESLRLYRTIPEDGVDCIATALFDDLHQSIHASLIAPEGRNGFNPISAKIASAQAAAALRNCEILARIEDLHEYDEFARTFNRQVSLVDSKVRPPQIDTGRKIPIDRIYVQATLVEEGERGEETTGAALPPKEIFGIFPRVAILGDPGGGKSTLASKLCVDFARGKVCGSARVSFKIIVRDFGVHFKSSKMSVVEYIEKMCAADYSTPTPDGCVEYLLLNSRAAVVFDGLDELTDTSLRQDMVRAVEAFCLAYPSAWVMATSRKVGYDLAPLDRDIFDTLELGAFSHDQERTYIKKWFNSMKSGSQHERASLADGFLNELSHANELSRNPLMLGLMCALYRGAGFIPRNRPELYRRCSEFLFERWDSSRGILVEKPFERGIQFAMFALALSMLKNSEGGGLTEKRLIQFATAHLHGRHYEDFDSAQDAARSFVKYCRGRAWVLTDVGTDASGNDLYSFTHRTFLEYFAARQLVRECSDVESLASAIYPKLKVQEWDVVSQLAIQTLDERLEDASNGAVAALIELAENEQDLDAQKSIASFCVRSVEFMDLRPSVLRSIVDFYLRTITPAVNAGKVDYFYVGAADALLKCPRELRDVVVDQMRRTAQLYPEDKNILALVVSLGQRIPWDGDYWIAADQETIEMFSDRMDRLDDQEVWFDVIQYRYGRVPLQHLLDSHGVGALFNSQFWPLGDALGRNLFSDFVYGPEGVGRVRFEDRGKVIRAILNSPRPLCHTLGSHRWIHDDRDALPEDEELLFLVLVNYMLGLDFLGNETFGAVKRPLAGPLGRLYQMIRRARKGEVSSDSLSAQLDMLPAAQVDFITSWAAEGFKLVERHDRSSQT
ncbi:NACHT domain-containing NTPase [Streptomyces sp. RK75]|uniref:NACHT domain-containing protein n=1 Tax=Streptomyces sp. RK75 TaxID=2824895 RepID=UPI001B37AA7A|nr:NACHT domain-containing protein [Streptomyces sp. RK75]MBQ0865133.1 NACHT domain-containing protein [Streptomyces sp. RK75]